MTKFTETLRLLEKYLKGYKLNSQQQRKLLGDFLYYAGQWNIDPNLREEVVQELFCNLLGKKKLYLAKIKEKKLSKGYLRTVAKNILLDMKEEEIPNAVSIEDLALENLILKAFGNFLNEYELQEFLQFLKKNLTDREIQDLVTFLTSNQKNTKSNAFYKRIQRLKEKLRKFGIQKMFSRAAILKAFEKFGE